MERHTVPVIIMNYAFPVRISNATYGGMTMNQSYTDHHFIEYEDYVTQIRHINKGKTPMETSITRSGNGSLYKPEWKYFKPEFIL